MVSDVSVPYAKVQDQVDAMQYARMILTCDPAVVRQDEQVAEREICLRKFSETLDPLLADLKGGCGRMLRQDKAREG